MSQSLRGGASIDDFFAIPETERFHELRPDVLGWRRERCPSQDGFVTVLRAERHETVHAEPFDDIAVSVSALFGDDPSDSP